MVWNEPSGQEMIVPWGRMSRLFCLVLQFRYRGANRTCWDGGDGGNDVNDPLRKSGGPKCYDAQPPLPAIGRV